MMPAWPDCGGLVLQRIYRRRPPGSFSLLPTAEWLGHLLRKLKTKKNIRRIKPKYKILTYLLEHKLFPAPVGITSITSLPPKTAFIASN